MPTFILLEDHPLVLQSLRDQIVGQFPDAVFTYAGQDLLSSLEAHVAVPADCAIVDLDLGDDHSPVDVVSALVTSSIPVLIVSALAAPATVQAVMMAGADGFVSKRADVGQLSEALEAVLNGSTYVSPELAGAMLSKPAKSVSLSEQEQRALVLYASGLKLDAVARKMGVAPSTVKSYIERVRDKYRQLGIEAGTKTSLYKVARDEGLLD